MRAKEGVFEAATVANNPAIAPLSSSYWRRRLPRDYYRVLSARHGTACLRRQYGNGSAAITECVRAVSFPPSYVGWYRYGLKCDFGARMHTDTTVVCNKFVINA